MSSVEAEALAERITLAQRKVAEEYRRYLHVKPEEALQQFGKPPADYAVKQALEGEPQQVTWYWLGELAKSDPALATRRWDEIKQAARDELSSGHRAARAVREGLDKPWELAQFLAIRASLVEQWQPQGGTDQLLIDTLAQSFTEQHRWIAAANNLLSAACHKQGLEIEKENEWTPPRVSEAEAIEQAMAMAERWNRIFLRTLRALRDLRRYAPTVMIQNAGQVNIRNQQLNVSD